MNSHDNAERANRSIPYSRPTQTPHHIGMGTKPGNAR